MGEESFKLRRPLRIQNRDERSDRGTFHLYPRRLTGPTEGRGELVLRLEILPQVTERNGTPRLLQAPEQQKLWGCREEQDELGNRGLLDLDESLRGEPLYRTPDLVGEKPAGLERVEGDPPRIFQGAQDPDFDGVECCCRQRFFLLSRGSEISPLLR